MPDSQLEWQRHQAHGYVPQMRFTTAMMWVPPSRAPGSLQYSVSQSRKAFHVADLAGSVAIVFSASSLPTDRKLEAEAATISQGCLPSSAWNSDHLNIWQWCPRGVTSPYRSPVVCTCCTGSRP